MILYKYFNKIIESFNFNINIQYIKNKNSMDF